MTSTMTLSALIAFYNTLAIAAGAPVRKSFESKAKAQAAIKALQEQVKTTLEAPAAKPAGAAKAPKAATLKIKAVRKAAKVREAGPRGFKFGAVWTESVKAGVGVALKPANMPKLEAMAMELKVTVKDGADQAELAAAIAQAL